MRTRGLRQPEVDLARTVFLNNLPYHQVRIADDLGLEDRVWTEGVSNTFVIHFGPDAFRDATSSNLLGRKPIRQTFIHELTHVWQGSHTSRWEYMADSFAQQAMLDERAYDYVPNNDWNNYHAEQQAHIIEDWFAGGTIPSDNRVYSPMDVASPLYKYVQLVRTLPRPKPDYSAF